MIRRFLTFQYIKLLEKYLGLPNVKSLDNKSLEFLADAWRNDGFRDYLRGRNDQLIYQAAGGSGLTGVDRNKYAELVGRRVENLNLAALAKKSFQAQEARNIKKRKHLSQTNS